MWMSQFSFSLGFLSQNSLRKLSTFRGYKSIYSRVYEECENTVFIQTGHSNDSTSRSKWVASLSRELTVWPNWNFCHVVLQLSWPFSSLACSICVPLWRLANLMPIARSSRETLLSAHILSFLHTLSHTTLT